MTEIQSAAPTRPLRMALVLTGTAMALTLALALLTGWLAPGLDSLQQRLIAVLVLAAVAVVTVARTGRELLVPGRARPVLLIVPLLIAAAPFAAGIKDPGIQTGTVIVLGYLATGVYEELWFRGLVLNSLAPRTPLTAALISSVLFGTAHLSNIAFGANPAITAAQVVGATCFGMGLAALRLRGVSLWPLILLHALTDIGLALGDLSGAWRWALMIGGDTIMLVFGLLILPKATTSTNGQPEPTTADTSKA